MRDGYAVLPQLQSVLAGEEVNAVRSAVYRTDTSQQSRRVHDSPRASKDNRFLHFVVRHVVGIR